MRTLEQIRSDLDSNIPRDVISEREGSNGQKLSYLAGWYVIDRMNQVFGAGNWASEVTNLSRTFEGALDQRRGNSTYQVNYVSYVATVRLSVKFPDGSVVAFVDVGFGDGQDRSNPGKAHELAVKEAVTDGVKRCAKSLGRSMGLALYDKSQEFISDAPVDPKPKVEKETQVSTKSENKTTKSSGEIKAIENSIRHAARILADTQVLSLDKFKSTYLVPRGVEKLAALTEDALPVLFEELKRDFPSLGL